MGKIEISGFSLALTMVFAACTYDESRLRPQGGAGGASGTGAGGSGETGTPGHDGSGGTGAGSSSGAAGTSGGTGTPGNYPLGNTPVPSAGCGKPPTLMSGAQTIGSRKYIIRLPDNYDNKKPHRLIFGLHWMGGTKEDVDTGQTATTNVWAYYGLKALDTEKTAIFVAPDGNNCGTWCKADETFIDDMYKKFREDLCIDESRVFATGFSFGAVFSYSLACDRPNIFRAAAALAATPIIGCTDGAIPVAYFGEVGMSDRTCTPDNAKACRDTFVTRNGCTNASPLDWTSSDGKTHLCYSYEGCKAGYPVRWCTGNFGHIAAPNDATTDNDVNSTWAKEETWKFFAQF
jgi:poly(3-hydroxybutyrate) depolymerase